MPFDDRFTKTQDTIAHKLVVVFRHSVGLIFTKASKNNNNNNNELLVAGVRLDSIGSRIGNANYYIDKDEEK